MVHGSKDLYPDPYQNVMNPEHCEILKRKKKTDLPGHGVLYGLKCRAHLCGITEVEKAEGELLQVLEPEHPQVRHRGEQAAHKGLRDGGGRPGRQAHVQQPEESPRCLCV